MIVTLDQRLFQLGQAALVSGLRLVLTATERGHVLLTDPGWDPEDESQPIQRWMSPLSRNIKAAVSEILEASLDEEPNMGGSVARVRVEPVERSQWEQGVLCPEDALRLMQTPLWLVLENGRNDLQFLRRILANPGEGGSRRTGHAPRRG
ncbi:hypothetical protein WME91_13885 [Sorangium sp. So ce269]